MDKEDLKEMKVDRLADYAVVIFLGALLLGQAWEIWEGRSAKLLGIFEVPYLAEFGILTIMAVFLGWSLLLALASIVTPLQAWGLGTLRGFSQYFGLVVIVLFFLSWLSSVSELPDDRWWTKILIWGGFGIFFFLSYRVGFSHLTTPLFGFLYQRFSWYVLSKPRDDGECDGGDDPQPSEAPKKTGFLDRVRSLRARCRWPESSGVWVSVSVAVGFGGLIVSFVSWDWLSEGVSESEVIATRSDVIRTVGLLVAGLVAFPLAIWRALVADRQASAAQQGVLSERYQKGVDMLGSVLLSVRLGGIYALQSLIEEYPEQYYVQTMRLLCAFVRNPTKDEEAESEGDIDDRAGNWRPRIRQDVQAIMEVMRNRDDTHISLEKQRGLTLDLRNSVLSNSNLRQVNLARVDLRRANLSKADLRRANLSEADLRGANLSQSSLVDASLVGADLSRATVQHVNLSNARLAGAVLSRASFIGAILSGTQFYDEGPGGALISPSTGLTQYYLDFSRSDPDNPPKLGGVVIDPDTGQPLVWRGESLEDERDK